MVTTVISIFSLIVALGALIFSFFTYFAHDRELKRQEKLINDFQISALAREEAEAKKAQIKGNIIGAPGKGNRELRIFNSGKVTARNVKVEWLNCRDDDGIYPDKEFSDLGNLSPQNPRKVHLSLNCGHEPTMILRYSWSDDYSENNSYEEEIEV